MKRAAIYTRVSSEEQIEGYSLQAQAEMCQQFAHQRGWTVVQRYEERGRSGKTVFRPEFQQMLVDAKSGQFDVLIVHKLDRFSRSLIDIFTKLNDLAEMGVSFVSSSEQFDFTTPFGKVILAILGAFAQWYVENLANETKKGKKQRALSGDWNGTLSMGYTTPGRLKADLVQLGDDYKAGKFPLETYEHQAGLLEAALSSAVDKHESSAVPCPLLRGAVELAFRSYATGLHSDNEIAWLLNEAGYRTTGQFGRNLFGKDTVRDLLQGRFYLGQTSYKGEWVRGNHEALIDPGLWEQCQLVRLRRAERHNKSAAVNKEDYPLASLLVCLDCGTHYHGWTLRGERRYRDPFRQFGRTCANEPKSVPALVLERQIETLLFDLTLPPDWKRKAQARLKRDAKAPALTERPRLEARLERLKKVYIAGDLQDEEYQRLRSETQQQIALLPMARSLSTLESAAKLLETTRSLWNAATPVERHEWLRHLFQTIYVREGQVVAVEPTAVLWGLIQASFDMSNGDDGVRTRTTYLLAAQTPRERAQLLLAA